MPGCQKCWNDAGWLAMSCNADKVDEYHRLVDERDCTPEEQAGTDAEKCPDCGRATVHEVIGWCTACGYDPQKRTRRYAVPA